MCSSSKLLPVTEITVDFSMDVWYGLVDTGNATPIENIDSLKDCIEHCISDNDCKMVSFKYPTCCSMIESISPTSKENSAVATTSEINGIILKTPFLQDVPNCVPKI